MGKVAWMWVSYRALPWWVEFLIAVYFVYFLVRTYAFWDASDYRKDVWKAYKSVIFGYDKFFRVYHIIRILFDIPPAVLGLLFPFLRRALAFKIYEFKDEKKETKEGV